MSDPCKDWMVLPSKSKAASPEKDWRHFCDLHRRVGHDACLLSILVTDGMKPEVVKKEEEEMTGQTGQEVYR